MTTANYELLAYAKAALFFDTLRGWLGDEMYSQIMRAYVETYRWRIATPGGCSSILTPWGRPTCRW